jgi:hypothetical protein
MKSILLSILVVTATLVGVNRAMAQGSCGNLQFKTNATGGTENGNGSTINATCGTALNLNPDGGGSSGIYTLITPNSTHVILNGGGEYHFATIAATDAGHYTLDVSSTSCSGYTTHIEFDISVGGITGCSATSTGPTGNTCTLTATATVTTPIACNGGTGTVTVTASDASTTTQSVSAGSGQTFTITSGGCTATTSAINVTQPDAISAAASVTTAIACNGGTGVVTVSATGGSGTYSSGTGTHTVSAGNGQSFTVTDDAGCTGSATVNVSEPSALTVTLTPSDAACAEGHNGSISAVASGGTGTLSYSWSPSGGFSATASGLTTGVYNVTVTDANSCSASRSATIGVNGNLMYNWDFEAGNTGFTTEYTNNTTSLWDEGTYDVSIATHHDAFQPGDHTSGAGKALWVNGQTTSGPRLLVWSETVEVTANANYSFSAWVKAVGVIPTPTLKFYINGMQIGGDYKIPDADQNIGYNWGVASLWEQFTASWNSGSTTSAVITIYDDNTVASGNDFGMDDISFVSSSLSVTPTVTNVSCNGAGDGNITTSVSGGTSACT